MQNLLRYVCARFHLLFDFEPRFRLVLAILTAAAAATDTKTLIESNNCFHWFFLSSVSFYLLRQLKLSHLIKKGTGLHAILAGSNAFSISFFVLTDFLSSFQSISARFKLFLNKLTKRNSMASNSISSRSSSSSQSVNSYLSDIMNMDRCCSSMDQKL